MKFSDEMLMAYADGELDLVARAEIEAAMAVDPALARAVERHRAMAAKLRKAFEPILDEPLPPALAALAGDEEAVQAVELAAARERHIGFGRWQLPAWTAIAASVLVGLFVGVLLTRGGGSPYEETPEGLVARGELADGLEYGLASLPARSNVKIGVTFRHRDGRPCRSFTFRHGTAVAGLACRGRADWKLELLADAPAEDGDLRAAASMPAPVARLVDTVIEGEPFDAQAESAAVASGWRIAPNVAE
ncbi:MAG TPA: hypothetical protein VFM30_01330 [Steroidobacteraceae bacterium]|nr:hypothetical protein [Steroidobacteraceae bacterium]